MMQFMVKKPNTKVQMVEVDDKENILKFMQHTVEGYIELIPTDDLPQGVDAFCNEEGKFMNLMPNLNLGYDLIVGNVIFSRCDEEGATISLLDSDIEPIEDFCAKYSV